MTAGFEVERTLRPLVRQIANPLLLGELGPDATHFVLGQHWKNQFTRKVAQTGSALTVGQLRQWIDDPRPMGLPREAANLVILAFAEQAGYTFYEHGGPQEGSLARLPDHFELRQPKFPPPEAWNVAVQRTGSILGVVVSPLLKVANVSALASQAKAKVAEHRAGCQDYARRLRERLSSLGIAGALRLKTAQAVQALVERLHAAEGDAVVSALASAEVATSEGAMGAILVKSAELAATLDAVNWEILDAVGRLTDQRREAAAEVDRTVREALVADEQAVPLAAALKEAQSKTVRLLTPRTPPPPLPPPPDGKTIRRGQRSGLSVADARRELESLETEARAGKTVTVNLTWEVVEGRGEK
jgi:hypothetical protein